MKKYIFEVEKVGKCLWGYTILCEWEGVGSNIIDYTTTTTRKQAYKEAIETTEALNLLYKTKQILKP